YSLSGFLPRLVFAKRRTRTDHTRALTTPLPRRSMAILVCRNPNPMVAPPSSRRTSRCVARRSSVLASVLALVSERSRQPAVERVASALPHDSRLSTLARSRAVHCASQSPSRNVVRDSGPSLSRVRHQRRVELRDWLCWQALTDPPGRSRALPH